MPRARLKKAIITTRYPTARDLADLLQVPIRRVEQLAEEVMQFQVQRMVGASRRSTRSKAQSEKLSGTRTVKKRAARDR